MRSTFSLFIVFLQCNFLCSGQLNRKQLDSLLSKPFFTKMSGTRTNDSISQLLLRHTHLLNSSQDKILLLQKVSKLKVFCSDYDSARYYIEKSRELLDLEPDPDEFYEFTYFMVSGKIYKNTGYYQSALQSLDQAMQYAHNEHQKGLVHQNLGFVYKLLQDYEVARKNFSQAFAYRLKRGFYKGAASSALAIGEMWFQLGQLDSALSWYHRADDFEMLSDAKARLYLCESELYLQQGKVEKAASVLMEVADIPEKAAKKELLIFFWVMVGDILSREEATAVHEYFKDISYDEAFAKALDNADQTGDISLIIRTKQKVAEVYARTGREREAYQLLAEANALKADLYDKARLEALRMETTLAKKEAERNQAQQSLRLRQQSKLLNLAIAFTVGLIALLIPLYRNHKRKNKLNKELRRNNEEILRKNKFLTRLARTITSPNKLEEHKNEKIEELQQLVLKNIHEINPTKLADILCISQRTLHRRIKDISGLTPEKFIQEVKLEQAMKLLQQEPEASMSEIAYQTGFSDGAYFSRVFKAKFGASPSKFIKTHLA